MPSFLIQTVKDLKEEIVRVTSPLYKEISRLNELISDFPCCVCGEKVTEAYEVCPECEGPICSHWKTGNICFRVDNYDEFLFPCKNCYDKKAEGKV